MVAAAAKQNKTDPHHSHASHHPPEGTVGWYFYEFWPVMFFGMLFITMCSLPVILSFIFGTNDVYSSSDIVPFGFGLGLLVAFLFAFVVLFVFPKFIGWYVFILGALALVFMKDPTHQDLATSWGPWIAILFLVNMFAANFFFLVKTEEKTSNEDQPPTIR